MTPDSGALQAELRARGLWRDEAHDAPPDRSAWYVRALLGAAAWLAACLLLPLLGVLLVDVIDLTPWSGFAAAVACCAMAVPLLRPRRGDFLIQLGSALSLAGLILAVSQTRPPDGPGWFSLGALACIMYWVAPESVHRFLSALVIAVAAIIAIDDPFRHDLSSGSVVALSAVALFIWGARLPLAAHRRWQALEPMAWAFSLVASVLALAVSGAWIEDGGGALAIFWRAIPAGLCALAPAIVWWQASRRVAGHDERAWPVPRVVGGLLLLSLAPVWLAIPGAALALCGLLMGFALCRVALLWAGAVALLTHLAAYYYQTHTSLLQKSFWLFAAGIVLVCVALLTGMWQRRSR